MHSLYLVSIPKKEAKTPREAISRAEIFLDSNGFASEGGLYSSPKADWYSVGGRWSGELLEVLPWFNGVNEKIQDLLKKKYPTLDSGVRGVGYGDKKKEALKKKAIAEIKEMWKELVPNEFKSISCPEVRDSLFAVRTDTDNIGYEDENSNDNAMICTKQMFDALKKKYEPTKDSYGSLEIVDTEEMQEMCFHEIESKRVIGNWLVVIDYHM